MTTRPENSGFTSLGDADQERILFLRCLEEADGSGTEVPLELRAAAAKAGAPAATDAEFLCRRADALAAGLKAPWPGLAAAAAVPEAPWRRHVGPVIVLGTFVLGWLTNELGADRRINVLSFPLLGLVAWNAMVAAWSLWHHWRQKRRPAPATPLVPPSGDTSLPDRVSAWFKARRSSMLAPQRAASVRMIIHTGALALTLGIVAGMYARGLVRAYEVSWESTFLDEPQVRAVTRVALGPASIVTGIPVPQPSSGSAAPWIHLWATTAGLFIAVPRLLLWNMARRERAHAKRKVDEEWHTMVARWRSLGSGQSSVVAVLPIHGEPEGPVRDAVHAVLQELWGPEIIVHFQHTLAYGAEDADLPEMQGGPPQRRVLLFPLNATPEKELHGALAARVAGSLPPAGQLVVLLDAAAFESRFGAMPEFSSRLASRRKAWQDVLPTGTMLAVLGATARREPAAVARTLLQAT